MGYVVAWTAPVLQQTSQYSNMVPLDEDPLTIDG